VDVGNTVVVQLRVGYEWLPLLLQTLVGIEPSEVLQVLQKGRRWPRPAVGDGIPMLAIWGRTRAGRYLIVVLRPTDVSHDWLIVGAREMTAEQAAEYDRWEAGHGH
jgi:hypothetical protein